MSFIDLLKDKTNEEPGENVFYRFAEGQKNE